MGGSAHRARVYAVRAGAIAVLIAVPATVVVAGQGREALPWFGLGWLITAMVGVVGGAWTVASHGKPGSAFMVAMGSCMLARLFAVAAGAGAAAMTGQEAVWPYLSGLGVGYIPLQIFEVRWFFRWVKQANSA